MVQALATPDHLICVAGSFFLAAEVRRQIQGAVPTTDDLTLQDVR
jgi:hypothetical protein